MRPPLRITQASVREIVQQFSTGELLVPEFQRPYIWKPNQAAKLLESLYWGYPIGSLLVWQSRERVTARQQSPRPQATSGRWLLDGQQRVTTLAWVHSGDSLNIAVRPVGKRGIPEFRPASAKMLKDPRWYSISHIWNDAEYREIVREHGLSDEEHRVLEGVRDILDVQLPIVEMCHEEFDHAVEAFVRLNKHGRRLSSADLESARVAAKHTGFIRDELSPFMREIWKSGLTGLRITHIFRACGVLARPDGRSRPPVHELSPRELQESFKAVKRGIKRVQSLLIEEFACRDMTLLRSGALLVPPIVVLGSCQSRTRPVRELAAWIALAALFHRYSKAGDTALDQDLRASVTNEPIGRLLSVLREHTGGGLLAKPRHFAGTLSDKGALFAVYFACRERGARDLFTGAKLNHHRQIQKHHIFPKDSFPRARRREADRIANICFIGQGTNVAIRNTPAARYLPDVDERLREQHCIPLEHRHYAMEAYDRFLTARQRLLANAFNEAIRERLPRRWLRD